MIGRRILAHSSMAAANTGSAAVQVGAHAGVLRALAGEQEGDPSAVAGAGAIAGARLGRSQQARSVVQRRSDERPSVRQSRPADLERVRDVRRDRRPGLRSRWSARSLPSRSSAGADLALSVTSWWSPRRRGSRGRPRTRRFLEHEVRVRAAEPERADGGPARHVGARPRAELGVHEERARRRSRSAGSGA